VEFSVGFALTEPVRDAIQLLPKTIWRPGLDPHDCRCSKWGGWGSNPRPRDYESDLAREGSRVGCGLSVDGLSLQESDPSCRGWSGEEWHKNGTTRTEPVGHWVQGRWPGPILGPPDRRERA
jgi:hypothetical protein